MMRRVATLLAQNGIPFDIDGNRIRCFPHIVNLCVKAGLRKLTALPPVPLSAFRDTVEDSDPLVNEMEEDEGDDAEVILFDPVSDSRKLAVWFKASHHRLKHLSDVIQKGHADGTFSPDTLPDVVPLKDMDIRWSSSHLMLKRLILLHPAMKIVLQDERYTDDERALLLTDDQLRRVQQINSFLEIPHSVQEIISAEKTPTLPVALPAYENLLSMLKSFRKQNLDIADGVDAAIEKLEGYLAKTRKTRIYAMSMGA
ncbi:hypothetical protein DFP72DRAFT_826832 [Ephemerocybe angulata]|uniref:Uncharacterized protein n=1 Tax=Ephemerocybe angulata TaxID=980116 RepID=A0A8H6HD59_9AGAR|nr:hypothetical protein DFP72DRAFT_826832 [Tulosesus angulatus]